MTSQPDTTSNSPGRNPGRAGRLPEDGLLPDLSLYERLIGYGTATADERGDSIDHVTARRLAIWLAARPQPPPYARGLVHFVNTGEITPTLKTQLRINARSGTHPNRPQAIRLMEYCLGRGAALGPVGQDFGATCDQIDRADLMLADLRDRTRQHLAQPQAWPESDGPRIIAIAGRDPESQTVSLILDATTANAALFAIAAHADEREAHVREVEHLGQSLPEGSYGRRNREAIATRETRVATRLRAVEHAYRKAIERNGMCVPTEPTTARRVPGHALGREMELE